MIDYDFQCATFKTDFLSRTMRGYRINHVILRSDYERQVMGGVFLGGGGEPK